MFDGVRIIARSTLVAFYTANPLAKASCEHWFAVTSAAAWKTSAEVLGSFSKAKVLNADRVRFEIAGGDFRLIVAFDFVRQIAFIKFAGTHAEYDRVDALTVSRF